MPKHIKFRVHTKRNIACDSAGVSYVVPDQREVCQDSIQKYGLPPSLTTSCLRPCKLEPTCKIKLTKVAQHAFQVKSIQCGYPGVYVYPSTIPGAGLGLFASCDLPANTRIPYLGVCTDLTRSDAEDQDTSYMMWCGQGIALDAHPKLDPCLQASYCSSSIQTDCMSNWFIAGRINEGTGTSQRSNCSIVRGKWNTSTKQFAMYIKTRTKVLKDSELFVHYNRRKQTSKADQGTAKQR